MSQRLRSMRLDLARDFARTADVLVCGEADGLPWGRRDTFAATAARDFGGLQRLQPAFVLCPADLAQAQAALRFLYDTAIPYSLRGAGHSPSGEVLCQDGAVLDLRGLSARLPSRNAREARVQGGLFWLPLCTALATQGLAPRVLTDNPHTSIAGTLSVGGFGDSSHLFGLQVDCVRSASLLLPTGERCETDADSPLLRYALAGHGQLGILGEVTLPLWRRGWALHSRVLHFADVASFVTASIRIAESQRVDYVRARAHAVSPHAVSAVVGTYGADALASATEDLPFCEASEPEWIDLLAHAQQTGIPSWAPYNPALEVVLPLPAGLDLLARLEEVAHALGSERLPRGYSLQVVRGRGASLLPLAPLPDAPWALMVALRPECQTLDEAQRVQACLLDLLPHIAGTGSCVYLASFPLPTAFVEAQLGPERTALYELKRRVDPKGLCNRGALFGYPLT